MTSDRPYRKALPDDVAREELAANAGTQFDPRAVEAVLAVVGERRGEPGAADRRPVDAESRRTTASSSWPPWPSRPAPTTCSCSA